MSMQTSKTKGDSRTTKSANRNLLSRTVKMHANRLLNNMNTCGACPERSRSQQKRKYEEKLYFKKQHSLKLGTSKSKSTRNLNVPITPLKQKLLFDTLPDQQDESKEVE
jgi:hypothetical protein